MTPELNARTAANRENPPARKRRRLEDDTAGAASAREKIQRDVDELAKQFGAEPLRVTSREDTARGKTRSRVPSKPPDVDTLLELFGEGMVDADSKVCSSCGREESRNWYRSAADADLIICGSCYVGSRSRTCSVPGCVSQARSGGMGMCYRHGGGNKCSGPGCEKAARSGGMCFEHGGGKKCSVDGCETEARSGGMCYRHSGGKRGPR